MNEYKFSAKNGFCPKCSAFGRTWFIQDKYIGGDTYEYCLMSVTEEKPKKYVIGSKRELAKWLNEDKSNANYDDALADLIIARYIDWKADYSDRAMIVWHGNEYIYHKAKHTLTAIPERKQETGWYDSYRECLKAAKEILEKQERETEAFAKGA